MTTMIRRLLPVLLLLLAAHWVMLFMFDVKPLYLRVATILMPMPFGFLLAMHYPGRLWPSAGAGFGMAVLAVLGMLIITATIDKVPVLPQDTRDWRETLEYVASIGLAFTTGVLAGEFYAAFRLKTAKPSKLVVLIAKAVTPKTKAIFCESIANPGGIVVDLPAIASIANPGMAFPRPRDAANTSDGSCQCVVARTMARARAAGSSDLKMPEPTNTASAPSAMQSAASAGVAMPPSAASWWASSSSPTCRTSRTRSRP